MDRAALLNLHKFLVLLWQADRYFREHRPDGVVLIDFPGFNWWIAQRAKAHGIPVIYYVPPQVWAWAQWRVRKMRRLTDHVLCALPFEGKWFAEKGCNAVFVGHPFFDEVRRQPVDEQLLSRLRGGAGPLVGILPGSRTQEVTHNLQWFLKTAALVHAAVPSVRFAVAAFKPQQAQIARCEIEGSGLPIEVYTGKTAEIIRAADCCMSVSGSVSLELLHQAKPAVILYWVSRPAYFVQSLFRKVKYITLVNLLVTDELFPKDVTPYDPGQEDAHRVLYPEYLTWEDKSPQIATHLVQWLTQPKKREGLENRLAQLRAEVGQEGASARAADYILAVLWGGAHPIPRPHFLAGAGEPGSARRTREQAG